MKCTCHAVQRRPCAGWQNAGHPHERTPHNHGIYNGYDVVGPPPVAGHAHHTGQGGQLHRTLLEGTVPAPPEGTGAGPSDLATWTADLAAQAARARATGVTPSEWHAVSQAPDSERELFLAVAETPNTSGAASSSGA